MSEHDELERTLKHLSSADAPAHWEQAMTAAAAAERDRRRAGASRRILPAFWLAIAAACALAGVVYLTFFHNTSTPAPAIVPGNPEYHFLDEADFRSQIRIAGIIKECVIIEDVHTGKQKTYTLGGELHGYVISAIGQDQITLVNKNDDKDTFVVKLYGGNAKSGKSKVSAPFRISGTVVDDNKKPVTDAWVAAYDNASQWVAGCATDAEGRYTLTVRSAISYLQAGDNANTLCVKKVGSWSSDAADVELLLSSKGLFTVSGTVTSVQGAPLPGVQVILWHGPRQRVSVGFCDAEGKYSIKTNRTVYSVSSRICDLTIMVDGTWNADTTVDLGFDKSKMFTISGKITTPEALNYDWFQLTAYDAGGRELCDAPMYAHEQDGYQITLAASCSRLVFRFSLPGATPQEPKVILLYAIDGNWNATTDLPVTLDADSIFTLRGTALDANGSPAFGAKVIARNHRNDGADIFLGENWADNNGAFTFKSNTAIDNLAAFVNKAWHSVDGPWSKDATVTLDISADAAPHQLYDAQQLIAAEATRFEGYLRLQELAARLGQSELGNEARAMIAELEKSHGDALRKETGQYNALNRLYQSIVQSLNDAGSVLPIERADEYRASLRDIAAKAKGNRLGASAQQELDRLEQSMSGRPLIGINIDGNHTGEGVKIGEVFDKTAAKAAGLAVGDVIVKLDGNNIADTNALLAELQKHKVGESVELTVESGATTRTLTLILGRQIN